jgi:hypothetical protein
MIIQITSNYFTAGCVLEDSICIRAAPIIHYLKGKDLSFIEFYCKKKKWKLIKIV